MPHQHAGAADVGAHDSAADAVSASQQRRVVPSQLRPARKRRRHLSPHRPVYELQRKQAPRERKVREFALLQRPSDPEWQHGRRGLPLPPGPVPLVQPHRQRGRLPSRKPLYAPVTATRPFACVNCQTLLVAAAIPASRSLLYHASTPGAIAQASALHHLESAVRHRPTAPPPQKNIKMCIRTHGILPCDCQRALVTSAVPRRMVSDGRRLP